MAASIYLPLGENLTKETGGLSSSIRVFRHCPDAVSQMRLLNLLLNYNVETRIFFKYIIITIGHHSY